MGSYLPEFKQPLTRKGKKLPSRKCLAVDSIGNRGEMLNSVYFGDYQRAVVTLWKRDTFNAKNQPVQLFIARLKIHYGYVVDALEFKNLNLENFAKKNTQRLLWNKKEVREATCPNLDHSSSNLSIP